MLDASAPPYPPFDLATRVLSLDGADDPYAEYEQRGRETKAQLLELLPADWSFDGKRVLDFGCGAGRTLRHFLAEAERGALWGADIDVPSIEWLRGALCPPLHAELSGVEPPLPFEDATFDLVWAISVFTHLTDQSLPWIAELHRILKPDGLLTATYMGRWNSEIVTGEPWDEERTGMNVVRHSMDWAHGGPMVLISDWWMRAHWGRVFDIVKVAPRVHDQTWPLLRKRDVPVTVEELERPGDDPREILALRHSVQQVRRELEFAQAMCVAGDEQKEAMRREFEESRSWKLTRPLRATLKRARGARIRSQ